MRRRNLRRLPDVVTPGTWVGEEEEEVGQSSPDGPGILHRVFLVGKRETSETGAEVK